MGKNGDFTVEITSDFERFWWFLATNGMVLGSNVEGLTPNIVVGFLCLIRKWLRSLLGANEEATFEIWCKKHPRDTLVRSTLTSRTSDK